MWASSQKTRRFQRPAKPETSGELQASTKVEVHCIGGRPRQGRKPAGRGLVQDMVNRKGGKERHRLRAL